MRFTVLLINSLHPCPYRVQAASCTKYSTPFRRFFHIPGHKISISSVGRKPPSPAPAPWSIFLFFLITAKGRCQKQRPPLCSFANPCFHTGSAVYAYAPLRFFTVSTAQQRKLPDALLHISSPGAPGLAAYIITGIQQPGKWNIVIPGHRKKAAAFISIVRHSSLRLNATISGVSLYMASPAHKAAQ